MRIAYLINQYPRVSHTFIRREIAALEARGLAVARFALRPCDEPLVDEADEAERRRTRVVLSIGALGLSWAALQVAAAAPQAFARAMALAVKLGRCSERGLLVHLIYLAEACALKGWLDDCGARHLHAHFGTNSATVALLCRLLGGPPYSFTVHGPGEFDAPRALSLGEKVRHAAFVVAVCEYGRSQLYRWADYPDWAKIHVVHCGVDAAYIAPASAPLPDAPRLVCVGRLAEQKGQLVLVQAAARLRDRGVPFELVLVGDGPMRGEVERLIARLDLEGHIRIAGWSDGVGVRREILASRALVLPSCAEGLPVVLMEALALGRPVIGTYVAGIPELVRPGIDGWLVPPGSVEDLVGALREALAASASQLEQMGRAGAVRVAERHDAAAEADKLAAIIAGPRPRDDDYKSPGQQVACLDGREGLRYTRPDHGAAGEFWRDAPTLLNPVGTETDRHADQSYRLGRPRAAADPRGRLIPPLLLPGRFS